MKRRLSFCRDSGRLKVVFYDMIHAGSEYTCVKWYIPVIFLQICSVLMWKKYDNQEYLYFNLLMMQNVFVVVTTVSELWAGW